jgi:hypothetical protein
LKESEQKIE